MNELAETSTLYRKIGRRYYPERYCAGAAFPPGAFLVVVNESKQNRLELTARVENVRPDYLALKAAAMSLEGKLVAAIKKATEGRCNTLTPGQDRAWEALRKSGITSYYHISHTQMAQEILDAITEASCQRKTKTPHGKPGTC